MFAVKGWNLDARTLKSQTEAPNPHKSSQTDGSNKGKKRKRGGPSDVTTENVARLWDRHVEGHKPGKSKGVTTNAEDGKRRGHKKSKAEHRNSELANAHKIEDGVVPVAKVEAATSDATGLKPSKSQHKDHKRQRNEAAIAAPQLDGNRESHTSAKFSAKSTAAVTSLPSNAALTPLQSAMRQKLVSARFRHLNQTLYTEDSSRALSLFEENPDMFEDYHTGFRQQVDVWPENPVDTFIAIIRTRGKVRQVHKFGKRKGDRGSAVYDGPTTPLPRTHGTAIIADLGCGDARLAQNLDSGKDVSTLNLQISSFDLVSKSALVTKADISNLPLEDGSVDVAIFCLALMGTNWISFVEEAYRILHWKGELWIAEIKSRFGRVSGKGRPVDHSVGSKKKVRAEAKAKAKKVAEETEQSEQQALATEVDGVEVRKQETEVTAFVEVLRRRGFVLREGDNSVDLHNKMFVKMEFVKAAQPSKGKGAKSPADIGKPEGAAAKPKRPKFVIDESEEPNTDDESKVLKPCLYKLR